jgi:hypothetical protein
MNDVSTRTKLKNAIAQNLSRQLFPYNYLSVSLIPENKGLNVQFLAPKTFGEFPFRMEVLNELDLVIQWLNEHSEVRYVMFALESDYQCFEPEMYQGLSETEITQLLLKLRLINSKILKLEQTTVFHLKRGIEGVMIELALACDTRMAYRDAELTFNHVHYGFAPCSLGVELLAGLVGTSRTRDWILTGRTIAPHELYHSGLVALFSDGLDDEQQFINRIAASSNHARVQTKMAINELLMRERWNKLTNIEVESLDSGDFHESLRSRKEETQAQFIDVNKLRAARPLTMDIEIK